MNFEYRPRYADLSNGDAAQYPGRPMTFKMGADDGRVAKSHQPELVSEGVADPVFQDVNDSDGDILYTVRI